MLLELDGIEKRFGGVHALRRGDLHADSGQVHALLGENGAGKSTMMKIIAGMQRRDGGSMRWRGEVVDFASPKEAHAVGISMVHQESLLAPHLTVAENVFLGQETLSGPLLDQKTMLAETRKLIEEHRFPLQADWRVERLSPAQKQLVEIVRALHGSSSLIIFDEPTSSLSDSETVEVFRIVKQLRERGVAILYITHRLVELDEIADHVTILRDGETVHSCPYSEIDMAGIVHHMVGRNVEHIYEREPVPPGAETLAVDLPGAKFEVRAGEIVGIAGLMGAGRTELCQTLFGITPADEGEIRVEGRPVSIHSPRQAVDAGIALITEDRQRTGLALALPIRPNVTLAHLDGVTRSGFVQAAEEKQVAERYIERLRIRASGPEQRAGKLSGGNQQKIVIAKWLYRDTKVVLFDEPTRGIDVNAKREVFSLMDEMAREGKAIVMVSSELPELLQVADRILVMREGEIVAELPRSTTQEQIMHYAAVGQMKLQSGMLQKLLPFFSLIALFVFLSIASPYFLTATNLSSVVRQTAVINIMALGMTLVIVSGGIDLSVGAILAFAGVVGSMAMVSTGSVFAGIAVALLCGLGWGFVNGFFTTWLKIPPFIVTLGTLGIARGVTLIISGGLPVTNLPKDLAYLGEGTIVGIPVALLILIVCAVITHVILHQTKLGRYTYAIGSNVHAAVYAGIPVSRYTIAVYAISGMLCGLAAMIECSRLMTGQPTAGQAYELQVIAAVVIGGGSLTGGEGSVIGTLIGAFIMGLLANGSDLLGINPYLQQAIIGAIIILAVALDEARKRRFAS